MNDNFETLLRTRHIPSPSQNLAQRIIEASQQKNIHPVQALWFEIQSMLFIPKPALALAASVILGLLIGLETTAFYDAYEQDWTAFLSIDEGDWL